MKSIGKILKNIFEELLKETLYEFPNISLNGFLKFLRNSIEGLLQNFLKVAPEELIHYRKEDYKW